MVSGYSCGMFSHVHAVLCTDCQSLRAAVLPGHPAELPRGNEQELGVAALARYELACPVSAVHRVQPWFHPGPCPRCSETLECEEATLLWD